MSVTVYKSSDSGAPVLTGTAGDLVALLKACLVDGYGSKAAAGWTRPYNGTNTAVFRPGSGLQHFFHIDDNSPNATAGGKEAQFRGSETASAVLTGTGFFPTTTQVAASGAGQMIRKSATADSTARNWIIIADARTAYIHIATGDTAGQYYVAVIGEFYSIVNGGDSYHSCVIGRSAGNTATATPEWYGGNITSGGAHWGVISGTYYARAYNGGGTSIGGGRANHPLSAAGAFCGSSSDLVGVDPSTAALLLAPVTVTETAVSHAVRGRMRGLVCTCQTPGTFGDGDTIAGSGGYSGRTFLVVKTVASNLGGGGSGQIAIYDITGPWETN